MGFPERIHFIQNQMEIFLLFFSSSPLLFYKKNLNLCSFFAILKEDGISFGFLGGMDMQIRKRTSKMTAVLLAAAVTLSAAVSLKDWNAAPVAAAEDTVKILAVGDSITDGFINGDNGYR